MTSIMLFPQAGDDTRGLRASRGVMSGNSGSAVAGSKYFQERAHLTPGLARILTSTPLAPLSARRRGDEDFGWVFAVERRQEISRPATSTIASSDDPMRLFRGARLRVRR